MILMKFINLFKKIKVTKNAPDICEVQINSQINDIYIIGNGPSLNNFNPEEFNQKFTIGTNRAWLWGNTDVLIWRDSRITDEIELLRVEKKDKDLWICSNNKSFKENRKYVYVNKLVDYAFKDTWMKKKLKTNIKWNGIIFHAIALAKHISPNATIHLLGVDLKVSDEEKHHFFTSIPGFNQGFYKREWNNKTFNYTKRLDMMYKNFELLKKNGYRFKNYSKNSKLTELFGYEKR